MKLVLAAILLVSFNASAAKYEVDSTHSNIDFKIRHLLGKVGGKFKEFSGEFDFDEKKPQTSTGKMTIKVASIDTGNEKRDDHLRSPDFFDADKFQEITFVGKKFTKAGANKFKLAGDMTMRGITKPVTFNVDFLGTLPKDPQGKNRTAFTAKSKINRKDFEMVWNKPIEGEGIADKAKKAVSKNVLGDEVEVELNIEAVAK